MMQKKGAETVNDLKKKWRKTGFGESLAEEKLRLAEKKLKQAAAKNTISKNAASRKVSRLTKRFNAAKAAK